MAIFVGGPPGLGGSGWPKITVGPIPPASSNRPISLPLDSYEEVAGLEQNASAAAADLGNPSPTFRRDLSWATFRAC